MISNPQWQATEARHYRSNYTFNAIEDGDLTVFEGEVVTAIPCPLDTTDDQVNNAVEDKSWTYVHHIVYQIKA